MKFEDLTCVCTCSACPEQYDVLYKGQIVGYIRYRYGYFRVNPMFNDSIDFETIVYDASVGDSMSGILPSDERDNLLNQAKKALVKYYANKEKTTQY